MIGQTNAQSRVGQGFTITYETISGASVTGKSSANPGEIVTVKFSFGGGSSGGFSVRTSTGVSVPFSESSSGTVTRASSSTYLTFVMPDDDITVSAS